MSNQDILNKLSLIECALYYKADGSDDAEGIDPDQIYKVRQKVEEALHLWHNITGLNLTE